jgi:hypothetical protein
LGKEATQSQQNLAHKSGAVSLRFKCNKLLYLNRGLPGSAVYDLSTDRHQLRRYTPAFLEAFKFRAAPAARKILDALEVLKRLSASKARSVPEDAPTEFVRRRWASHVFTEAGLDRRYYELCALTELRNGLRSGDIWVPGSRQFTLRIIWPTFCTVFGILQPHAPTVSVAVSRSDF